jgi:hypothetical protein
MSPLNMSLLLPHLQYLCSPSGTLTVNFRVITLPSLDTVNVELSVVFPPADFDVASRVESLIHLKVAVPLAA